jgi:hypothetical protein
MPTAINPLVVKDGVLHNDMRTALVEAEVVMGAAVREVLDRAGAWCEEIQDGSMGRLAHGHLSRGEVQQRDRGMDGWVGRHIIIIDFPDSLLEGRSPCF